MTKKYFLISHNEYAKGLKEALEMIAGPQKNVASYCLMPGDFPDDIITKIAASFNEEDEVVILGDMAGGSMCNAAMKLSVLPNVVLVSGTNLPMAMEIILTQVTDREMINGVIANIRGGMKTLSLELSIHHAEDELFG
ncbi:PTS sugar transporter subunit IIA [Enterococcus casseliflavus]|uniref:PTS sugar transporter subunit IIA n=1 Tax=Enterococcus casseliflavus TaxID=37734 RepID=UPI003D0C1DED